MYLNEIHLQGFDKYKYNAIDNSLLSVYVMHPFWNAVVKVFPLWIAPNLMTFTGFMIQVVSFIMLSLMDWSYYASSRDYPQYPAIPNALFTMLGIWLFVAHTLDGIDGKQARRTNSSTPLGELFDHGSDSVMACLLALSFFSVFGRSTEDYGADIWTFYWIVWVIVTTFFLSHWEKYLTGVMFLPWSYDFSQLIMAGIYLLTGLFGYEIWKGTHSYGFEFQNFFIVTTLSGSILLSVPNTLVNIYKSYRYGTGKNRQFWPAIEPLIAPIFLFTVTTLWAIRSPSHILEQEPRMFTLLVGITVSNISCRLIISQMTETKAALFNWLLFPITGVASACIWYDLGVVEVYLLYLLTVIVVLTHVHFAVNVVNELADHFNINVFSLEKRTKVKKSSMSG